MGGDKKLAVFVGFGVVKRAINVGVVVAGNGRGQRGQVFAGLMLIHQAKAINKRALNAVFKWIAAWIPDGGL